MRDLRRTLDRLPLGPIMATAFAAALAFALYAMPGWLLGRAVVATGLPSLVSAAAPPLGATARGALMLIGALVGGAAVYALFDRIERAPASPVFAPEDAPTLRRADAHPDAPARRPIFAAADLGAPLDEAPDPAWREEEHKPSPPAQPGEELLLDHPAPDPIPAGVVPRPASSSADLIARLEGELRRRGGTAPPSKLVLRDEIAKLRARG